jgi:hypothetical protein
MSNTDLNVQYFKHTTVKPKALSLTNVNRTHLKRLPQNADNLEFTSSVNDFRIISVIKFQMSEKPKKKKNGYINFGKTDFQNTKK